MLTPIGLRLIKVVFDLKGERMQGVVSKKMQIGIIAAFVAAILAIGMGFGAQPAYAKQNSTLTPGDTTVVMKGTKTGTLYKVKNGTTTSGVTLVGFKNPKKAPAVLDEELEYNGTTYEIGVIAKNAFKGTKLKKVTLPKYVWKIKAKAFAKSKIKTVTITTPKVTERGMSLSKKNVKKSLKSSKVKTIKCAAGAKSMKKTYKKYFKKSNSGKKVKVK